MQVLDLTIRASISTLFWHNNGFIVLRQPLLPHYSLSDIIPTSKIDPTGAIPQGLQNIHQ